MTDAESVVRGWLQRAWVRALLAIAALAGVVALFFLIRHLLTPFFIGLALAYLLDPVVSWLERRRIPRAGGILLMGLAVVLTVAIVAVVVVPRAQEALVRAAKEVPSQLEGLKGRFAPMWQQLDQRYHDQIEKGTARAKQALEENLPKLLDPVRRTLQRAFSSFVNFFVSLVTVFFVPVFAFYLLKDIEDVRALSLEIIPPRFRDGLAKKLREVDHVVSAFIRGQLIVATILAAIYSIGLAIIGVPGSVLVGIFCGYANLVPYLGISIGIPLASILAFMGSQDFSAVVWVWVLFAVAQFLEGVAISPYVVGERVGLHPVVIILSLMIWGEFLGFVGLLLAVPATAALTVLARDWYRSYLASAFYRGPSAGAGKASP